MEVLPIIRHFLENSKDQEKWNRTVTQIDNLDKSHREVLNTIDELYQLFPEKESVTQAELVAYLQQKNPSRDLTYVSDVIQSALAQDIGPEVTEILIEAVIERHQMSKASLISGAVVSNQAIGKREELRAVLDEWDDMVSQKDRPDALDECTMSYEDAIAYRASDSGIKWPLSILNKCLGGVEPSLGLVIARPDTGKTSFILNCLAYFAYQIHTTKRNLLYCGNEEGIVGLKARCGVSLIGWDTEQAENNPRAFGQQVSSKGGDSIRYHGGIRSTKDVETLLKRYEPVVLVADQIGKFRIPGREVDSPSSLAEVYGWFRQKSEEYGCMVIGVAQADAKGDNKQWLSLNHINNSKTDVPGELDFGIGIGAVDEAGLEMVRFINIFKNKMKYGIKDRDQVNFNPQRCRYKG